MKNILLLLVLGFNFCTMAQDKASDISDDRTKQKSSCEFVKTNPANGGQAIVP